MFVKNIFFYRWLFSSDENSYASDACLSQSQQFAENKVVQYCIQNYDNLYNIIYNCDNLYNICVGDTIIDLKDRFNYRTLT